MADTRGMTATGSRQRGEGPKEHSRRLGSARDAMLAVTRLLSPDGDLQAPDAVRERLVSEAREFFGVRRVVLLRAEGGQRLRILASSPSSRIPRGTIGVEEFPGLRDPAENDTVAFASGEDALRLDTALGSMDPARSVLTARSAWYRASACRPSATTRPSTRKFWPRLFFAMK